MTYFYMYNPKQFIDPGAVAAALHGGWKKRRKQEDEEEQSEDSVEHVKDLVGEEPIKTTALERYTPELGVEVDKFLELARKIALLEALEKVLQKKADKIDALQRDREKYLRHQAAVAELILRMQEEEEMLLMLLLD